MTSHKDQGHTTSALIWLAWMLVLFALRAEAAPSIHDPNGPIYDYCIYCHVDTTAQTSYLSITVWRGEDQAALCLSCHNPTGIASAKSDVALHRVDNGARIVDCASCHNPHAPETSTDTHPGGVSAPNLSLIRADTSKHVPGALTNAVFQRRPDHFAFGETNGPWNGICQSCHQNTLVHTNSTGSDHNHNLGLTCTECHQHKDGFLPLGAGDCAYCHNVPRGDNGDGTFRRRQIFDVNGDFLKTSHHVKTNVQVSDCSTCHYLNEHARGTVILQDQDQAGVVYRYNPADPASLEPFCLSCHDGDGSLLGGGTQPFSDGVTVPDVKGAIGSEWANAAHKTRGYANNGGSPLTCLGDGSGGGCHSNGHASDNEKLLALPAGATVNQLCFNCHADGKVTNNAISGAALATSIQGAFNLSAVHNMETSFKGGSYTYSLQCTTCHNPHIVTGKHSDVAAGQSPVTRPDFTRSPADNPRAMGSALWGAGSGQKADDYAAGGAYRTPKGDAFSGAELPDYNSLCLDCHGVGAMPTPSAATPNDHGGIDWAGDAHGKGSANVPNGGGTVPDWHSAGKATGWNGDDCIGLETDCWPVMTRGKGEQIWTRQPYDQEARIGGANFVLQCVDCHEAHGSNTRSMLRTNPNGGTGTTIWNTMCNNCHYYYSDWHAGMSCGNASCHVSDGSDRMYWTGTDSIHQMGHRTGAGGTRSFDPELVADMRFDNNLNDSGAWRMHGRWFDTQGSYAAGRSGNAVVLNGDQPIELGTRNAFWSTDEGKHGTWKYTEMKYNTTLEAWVNPTDNAQSEYIIFTKHVHYNDGGYRLSLQKINGGLSVVLYANVNGASTGVRGAYSAVNVPLNKWTHVAAVFDTAGPDRDPLDPSAGRIRIYVNGEDVTTSNASGTLMQPGAGETTIFPYSEQSPANQSICYASHWCASAFSVGGVMWGSGSRSGFIGMLDDAKVWNVSKPLSYFQLVDAATAPRIVAVSGAIGSTQLFVTFSEGIYAVNGGALQLSNFSYSNGVGTTITAVDHVAGSNTARLTLSSALSLTDDIGVGVVQVTGIDDYGNAAEVNDITVAPGGGCPSGQVVFDLNEAAGSTYTLDAQGAIAGLVNNPALALPGDGSLHGDGVANYVAFDNNTDCLLATQAQTIEVRIQPTGIDINPYIKRILAKDSGGNYQLSVWRADNPTAFPAFTPPAGVASIALWVKPTDAHGGTVWKPVLTDYSQYPIVSDHWYRVKAVWNSNKPGGVANQPYVQADIFVDDEGTDGLGTGENWVGYRNATNATQSYQTSNRQLYTGDIITAVNGSFAIGVNVNNHANNLFNGLIDWVTWQDAADYTGVDDPPN
ncbi:MAG: hypothetical protein KZQ95_09305 [Candidatus Thiodiazotropha sp. (ex Epidulcina cf. delphinae)]|nr:hypothetical protein [Candidatus Thiodiazotropha sp. (ex Epidulcina cf. delphinae)]